eukprot:TRINITY_DN14681_c0_g1_i1.p1 TRINITY_DN14681_c0_g1~~TRINITY_DN14681_c0_g1_i1.p1  ORF type:complete len:138 (-),score=31.88 TRINITY_DN14681_c0_g1_i1:33-401(-)
MSATHQTEVTSPAMRTQEWRQYGEQKVVELISEAKRRVYDTIAALRSSIAEKTASVTGLTVGTYQVTKETVVHVKDMISQKAIEFTNNVAERAREIKEEKLKSRAGNIVPLDNQINEALIRE